MSELAVDAGLFLIALAAAMILLMQSEAGGPARCRLHALAAPRHREPRQRPRSVVNWLIDRDRERFRQKRWFPVSDAGLRAARSTGIHRYGKWSLLLSWMAIIGDPLTVAAAS